MFFFSFYCATTTGWVEWKEGERAENEYNILWRDQSFPLPIHLHASQNSEYKLLNHFNGRDTRGFCAKDQLGLNLRRCKTIYGSMYAFIPSTFVLPKETFELKKAMGMKRHQGAYWIHKPTDGRRGGGIFLFKTIDELNTVIQENDEKRKQEKRVITNGNYLVQRYIDKPCLVAGYKFDLRLYVYVASFWPLQVFLYRKGLTRFSTQPYDNSEHKNLFSHLTNSTINYNSPDMNADKPVIGKGCKWTIERLFDFLEANQVNQTSSNPTYMNLISSKSHLINRVLTCVTLLIL